MKHSVDLRFEVHNFTQTYRIAEIDIIHRRSDYIAVRMPVCRQRSCHVNKMHYLSAKKFPQWIRLRRQYNFRHLRTRCADRLPAQFRLELPLASVFPLHSSLSPRAKLDAAGGTRIIRDDPM